MAMKTIRLLILFYAMYFLGHFSMSTVYRLGSTATTAFGCASLAAIIFTLWKAAVRSESTKGIVYGIVSGFFIWCFIGEFLEHEGIMEIATLKATPALMTYIFTTLFIIYRRYLPIGVRFALGHFGCVWLLHSILVNQSEVLQFNYPELFNVSITVTGVVFFLTALFMIVKTLVAQSERAFVAYLLLSFILVWATVETLQVLHIVPDYTYYSYWGNKLSPGTKPVSFSEKIDKHIELITECYVWKNEEIQERACFFLKRLPSPHFLDDFSSRLDDAMKNKNGKSIDEALFYKIMEESFVTMTTASFDKLLKGSVKQFKEGVSLNHPPNKSAVVQQNTGPFQATSAEKISFIKEHYEWENDDTLELACHLLNRFYIHFLTGDDFIKRLDTILKEVNKSKVDESLLCQAMKDCFSATTTTVFTNLLKTYAQPHGEKAT